MNFIKKHYDKIILSIVLIVFASILLSQKTQVEYIQELKSSESVGARLEENDSKKVVAAEDTSMILTADQLKEMSKVVWTKSARSENFQMHKYIICKNSDCKRIIDFELASCPFCNTEQGLSQEENVKYTAELKKLEDGDGDGIINGIEDAFDVLNPELPHDAMLDADADGFTNLEEIVAGMTMEEQVAMYKTGQMAKFSPVDIKDHPEFVTQLRLLGQNRARSMGVTFKNVNEIDPKDEKTWELAFNVWDNDAKKHRTKFCMIGSEILAKNGVTLTIESLDRSVSTKFNAKLQQDIKIIHYSVTLKGDNGEKYTVKKGDFIEEGSKTVKFVYINSHSAKKLKKFNVEGLGKFDLAPEVDGNILAKIPFQVVEIKLETAKIKNLKDNTIYTIGQLTDADKNYIRNRGKSVKYELENKEE